MKVWRVEDSHGFGPYSYVVNNRLELPEGEYIRAPWFSDDTFRHPYPEIDGIEDFPIHYIFGFGSTGMLENWFPMHDFAVRCMSIAKLEIVTYEVSQEYVISGGRQLVFSHGHATQLERIDPALYREKTWQTI